MNSTNPRSGGTFCRPSHFVQFYEGLDFLYSTVGDYLAEGFASGEPAIVIATPANRSGFTRALERKGFDVAEAVREGRLTFCDARETLASFMAETMPDAERFASVVGGKLQAIAAASQSERVRAFGEMVDLLWQYGNPEAAIRLEELWNDLGDELSFSLLCAYRMGNFVMETTTGLFEEVCRRHERVIPAESYPSDEDDAARARKIALLQQRAFALEAEIAHRKQLEKSLRDALTAQRHAEEERARVEKDNEFLLEGSMVLNRSLDFETKLRDLDQLLVPTLADTCSIDMTRDGEDDGRAEFAEDRIIVPMKINGHTLGTITIALTDSGRTYTARDFAVATEFGRRAAEALENARLYHLAQESNRIKDEFLATLSHELRTPLTAILGWARLLTIGIDAETTRTAIETIERSARTQASLIDDLLDLSRVVTGKLALQSDLVDLGSAVDNALQTLRLAAEARDIRFDVAGLGERSIVTGDPTRLQQIVWNLLSNAIKFSNPGEAVSVSLEHDSEHARVVVRDSGCGIHPDFLPHVFEPFRQADGGSTRAHGGLGLGLAIVKYLAELHGGSVRAESEGLDHGATLTVTLPLASRKTEQAAAVTRDEGVDLSGTHILLVDDDADTRELMAAILRRFGADVDSAPSAAVARERLQIRRPDILVSDIAMPEQDGFALIGYLRGMEDPQRPIPAVALTAIALPDSDERFRAAGFTVCASKPVDPIEFARMIAGLR